MATLLDIHFYATCINYAIVLPTLLYFECFHSSGGPGLQVSPDQHTTKLCKQAAACSVCKQSDLFFSFFRVFNVLYKP